MYAILLSLKKAHMCAVSVCVSTWIEPVL